MIFKIILNYTSRFILLRYCLECYETLIYRVCEECPFTVYCSLWRYLHIVLYALHLLSILVLFFKIIYTHVLFFLLYIFDTALVWANLQHQAKA
jgi:hypothetical protein